MNLSNLLKTHENLLIVVVVLGVVLILGNSYINHSYDKAIALQQHTEDVLTQQLETNKQLQQTVQLQSNQYQSIVTTLTNQNSSLAKSIVTRTTAVAAKQKVDATVAPADLVPRWKQLLPNQNDAVTYNPSDKTFTVDELTARDTTEQLETIPAYSQNIADQQTILDNKDKQIQSQTGLSTDLQNQITGLNTQIVAEQNECKAQINLEKAKGRKSKRNFFIAGFITGIAAHFLGI